MYGIEAIMKHDPKAVLLPKMRFPKNKYAKTAEKLRKAANALVRVANVAKLMEKAKKDNPNHLIF